MLPPLLLNIKMFSMKQKIISFKQIVIASPFLIIFLLLTTWAILFSAYSLTFAFFIILLLFIPINHKYYYIGKSLVLFGFIIFLTRDLQRPVREVNNEIARLAERSPDLSTKEKLEIYGLNLLMGIAALPIYPEVARETLTLTIPSRSGEKRIFKSDFMINSPKIKNELDNLYIDLQEYGAKKKNFYIEKRVTWSADAYSYENQLFGPEARVALALNPCLLTIEATYIDVDLWQIELSCLVEVAYPEKSYVTILKEPELRVEEGLFYQLQQAGWLHPYKAQWQHSFIKDFNN